MQLDSAPARKRILPKLLALGASMLVALLVVELFLRRVVELPLERPIPQVRYESHPIRRFTLRPDQAAFTYESPAHVDARGFRTHGHAAGEADTTLVALGDSYTFGMGVGDEETWPAQLERMLNARRSGRVSVVNAGTISYNFPQELHLFKEKCLALKPKVVIHGLCTNDYLPTPPLAEGERAPLTPEGYFTWDDPVEREGALLAAIHWGTRHSAVLATLRNVVKNALSTGDAGLEGYAAWERRVAMGQVDDAELGPVDDFYRELSDLGRQHGFQVYVAIFCPSAIMFDKRAPDHAFVRHVRTVLDGLGIRYVDSFAIWPTRGYGRETILPADGHYTAQGYAVVAEELAKLLPSSLP